MSESNFRQMSGTHSTTVGGRVAAFLKAQHPIKTIESASAETGIPYATIAKWLERASVPNGMAMMRLVFAYGPEFVVAVWPNAPRWMHQAYREYQQAALTSQIEALQRQLEKLP